jgi:hypothetical protein
MSVSFAIKGEKPTMLTQCGQWFHFAQDVLSAIEILLIQLFVIWHIACTLFKR